MKYIKRPCNECPWRKDAEPGRFAPERWASLEASVRNERGFGPEYDAPLFACHKTEEGRDRVCAGWLAQEGIGHPQVRLAIITGELPACATKPGEGWPELHDNFDDTARHDMEGLA